MRFVPSPSVSIFSAAALAVAFTTATPLPVAPTDVQQPGTQPLQANLLGSVATCEGCHGFYDPEVEPVDTWMGSMMAHAGRDPLFWAALAIAEGDVPGSGDYCIRCHSPRGWHEGRATPSDGSALNPFLDQNGIECALCHQLVNPDKSEHPGIQPSPFEANDGGTPAQGYYSSGMQVLAGNSVRYGPYDNATAGHPWAQSLFHRSPQICGTCHDVSNPLVGDLAPNNGAQTPLPAGSFSGVPGAPVTQKAAFNNFPYKYGIVERTFSEHFASALSTTRVRDFPLLPADVRRGAIERAHQQAQLAGTNGDHEDGTPRFFSCQSCHMEPAVGEGAAFNLGPVRSDLGKHDLTGGNTWVPNAIKWLDSQSPSRLRLGQNISPAMSQAMDRGVLRARATLRRAGALDVTNGGNTLRVTNLTGHKLITGYPEGRRMWLRATWRNEQNQVLRQDGSYGSFTATVNGQQYTVNSITDPNARIYQAKLGITQDWAIELLGLGVSPTTPLAFDRVTGQPTNTLIQLAASAPGSEQETFHFVLNNKLLADNRIPPYGFRRDVAVDRNALPVPATQYGNPGPGGVYQHFDDVPLSPPAGATRAEFELLYQTSSWEYVQFLLLANPGTNAFLASAGQDVFDAWLATGQSPPEVMTQAHWCRLPGTNEDLVLRTSVANGPLDTICGKGIEVGDALVIDVTSPNGTHQSNLGALCLQLYDAALPPATGLLPGLFLDRGDIIVPIGGVPASGWTLPLTMPPVGQDFVRFQVLMLTSNAANGLVAISDAIDIVTL